MRKSKFTEAQIVAALKENEAGRKAGDVCRELGIAQATLYAWRKKYGGLEATEVSRLRELEAENTRLRACFKLHNLGIRPLHRT